MAGACNNHQAHLKATGVPESNVLLFNHPAVFHLQGTSSALVPFRNARKQRTRRVQQRPVLLVSNVNEDGCSGLVSRTDIVHVNRFAHQTSSSKYGPTCPSSEDFLLQRLLLLRPYLAGASPSVHANPSFLWLCPREPGTSPATPITQDGRHWRLRPVNSNRIKCTRKRTGWACLKIMTSRCQEPAIHQARSSQP